MGNSRVLTLRVLDPSRVHRSLLTLIPHPSKWLELFVTSQYIPRVCFIIWIDCYGFIHRAGNQRARSKLQEDVVQQIYLRYSEIVECDAHIRSRVEEGQKRMISWRTPRLPIHSREETVRVVWNSGITSIGKIDWMVVSQQHIQRPENIPRASVPMKSGLKPNP